MTAKPASRTPLYQAIFKKNLEEVRRLLAAGADPNELSAGYTPLLAAAHMDHADIVSELLRSGARPNDKGVKGYTPLSVAAEKGSLSCANALLNNGASIDEPDVDGTTPLMHVATNGSVELVFLLLSCGADPNRVNQHGDTPLSFAAWAGKTGAVEKLLAADALVNNHGHLASSPLLRAAARGRTDVIYKLLDSGADTRTANLKGQTALHSVAARGYAGATIMLLAAGADPNARDRGGRTSLLFASHAGHRNTFRALVSYDANPDLGATDGKEPSRVIQLPPIHRRPNDRRSRPLLSPVAWVRWVAWGCIVLFSKQRTIDGVPVWMFGLTRQESEVAFNRVRAALRLMAHHTPAVLRRMRLDVRRILGARFLLGPTGSFEWGTRTCMLAGRNLYGDEASTTAVACTIVHEATHARLASLGFGYSEIDRLRIERACVRATTSFVRSVPGADSSARREELMLGRLDAGSLTNTAIAERLISGMKKEWGRSWVTRLGEWMIRSRGVSKNP